MNSNLQTIKELDYTIIPDKNLAHQDLLFKLIIIGDTGNSLPTHSFTKPSRLSRCGEELSACTHNGQRFQD